MYCSTYCSACLCIVQYPPEYKDDNSIAFPRINTVNETLRIHESRFTHAEMININQKER